jgi:hypothetical protein
MRKPKKMILPNFLIIGAGKAGTQSLVHYLAQHPSIFILVGREPSFFALEGQKLNFRAHGIPKSHVGSVAVTNIEKYCELFCDVRDETAIGEKSPLYLYHPQAPKRIKKYVPKAKLIAVLRNPVERSYSAFLQLKSAGREYLSFEQALSGENVRACNNWGYEYFYKDQGFYYTQLQRYFDIFASDQVKVYLYEDFKTDPISILLDIFRFLGVDDTFLPDLSLRHNVGGVPRSKIVHSFLVSKSNSFKNTLKLLLPRELRERMRHFLRDINLHKPHMLSDTRKELIASYREDVLKLQCLVKRDLSNWLE